MGLPVTQCREVAAGVCSESGVDLEDFSIARAGRREVIRVIVDRDGGIDLDSIAEISRTLSDQLDVLVDSDETPYVLEVSSPGVDRPLTELRHWRRAVNHLVNVDFTESAEPAEWRVRGVEGDLISLTDLSGVERQVSLSDIKHAVVQVEFNRGE